MGEKVSAFAERYAAHVRLAILLRLIEPPEADRRRLFLLRVLAGAPGGALTASLLHEAAADFVPAPPRDVVVSDLAWLAGLDVVLFDRANGVARAVLLARGRDLVEDRTRVPGVAPLPTIGWVQDGLRAISLAVSRSDLDGYLDWLREAGLVRVSGGPAPLVSLTPKGRDVALGRDRCEGVKEVSHETMMRLAAAGARSMLEG